MKAKRIIPPVKDLAPRKKPAGKSSAYLPGKNDHCLIIDFHYPENSLAPLYELEQLLTKEIETYHLGQFDGHGISMDDRAAALFMYGPNARKLFRRIEPLLKKAQFMKNAEVYMRFGPLTSEVRDERFKLKFK